MFEKEVYTARRKALLERLAGEKGAPVILSTDAHKVSNLVCNKDRIEAFAAEHGLSLIRPVYKTGRLEWAL